MISMLLRQMPSSSNSDGKAHCRAEWRRLRRTRHGNSRLMAYWWAGEYCRVRDWTWPDRLREDNRRRIF